MSLESKLKSLFDLVRDEAKRNPGFRDRLQLALADKELLARARFSSAEASIGSTVKAALSTKKRGNRRPPALVDPIAEAERGEVDLREKLVPLTLEQLRDVIADFRMDPGKLVMKWKDSERVIDHIVNAALVRRQKGDAFRAPVTSRKSEPASFDIVKQFDEAMFTIYRRAKSEANYNATIFFRMLNERGGLETAKYLINATQPSEGYTHLYERGRLDLTVEAMVVEEKRWQSLFTEEELAKARKRLSDYRYQAKAD
jgi:hypothetical protein